MSELPKDLADRGWKLVDRAPDRMFAVSPSWGCTGLKATIGDVIQEAREMVRYCVWREAKEQELSQAVRKDP